MTILTGDVVENEFLTDRSPFKYGIVIANCAVIDVYCPKERKVIQYAKWNCEDERYFKVVGHINLERAMEEAIKEGI